MLWFQFLFVLIIKRTNEIIETETVSSLVENVDKMKCKWKNAKRQNTNLPRDICPLRSAL